MSSSKLKRTRETEEKSEAAAVPPVVDAASPPCPACGGSLRAATTNSDVELDDALRAIGLRRIEIPGEGDRLFHCLSYFLRGGDSGLHAEVRRDICERSVRRVFFDVPLEELRRRRRAEDPLPAVTARAGDISGGELAYSALAVAERGDDADDDIGEVCTVLARALDDMEFRFYCFDRRPQVPVVRQFRCCRCTPAGEPVRTVHLLQRDQRFEVLVPL